MTALFHARRRGALPLLLLLLLLLPRLALAHATLVASDPTTGAVLSEAPARLSLGFDEPVQLLALSLLDQDGASQDLMSTAAVSGARIAAELPRALSEGGYLLSWRASSLDGHVISGTVAFSVGTAAAAPQAAGEHWRWPGFAFRLIARLAVLWGAGMALFLLLVAGARSLPSLDRAARVAAGVAFPLVLLAFAAMGAERAGLSARAVLSPAAWSTAATAPGAWAWLASLVALLILASVRHRMLRLAAALAAPCLLAGSGHALAIWPGAGQALLWLHGIAAAAWTGALWPLRWSLRHDPHAAPQLFRRFHSVGLGAFLLVAASGIALSVAALPSLETLWSSAYGLRLSAKLLVVGLMVAIAVAARRAARRAKGEKARPVLRSLLALDLILAAAVVILATGLSLDPPPRALTLTMQHERGAAVLALEPGRVGDNMAGLTLTQPDGAPLDPREIELRVSSPSAGVAPVTVQAEALGEGRYRAAPLPLWVPGPWEIELRLLIDDFTLVTLRSTVTLAP